MVSGVISICLVFLVERLGSVFQIGVSTRGVTDGPLLGLFVLGMLVPWANAKGTLVGGYVSVLSMLWLVVGALWHTMHNKLKYDPLPTSTDGCLYPLNQTLPTVITTPATVDSSEEPMILFQISFMHYNLIGATIVVVVGIIASYVFGMNLESVNPDHITPMMQRYDFFIN